MHAKKDTKCAQLFKRISLAGVFWGCAFSSSSRIFENVKPFLKRLKKGTRASVAKITGLSRIFEDLKKPYKDELLDFSWIFDEYMHDSLVS